MSWAQEREDDVVVAGAACRLPGGLDSPARLWRALLAGRDCTSRLDAAEWKRRGVDDPPAKQWRAGLLEDPFAFDAAAFAISDGEAALMDPQQRLLAACAVEALIDAGLAPSRLAGTDTGVWTGSSNFEWATRAFPPGARVDIHAASGASPAILANRISHFLDLAGPSMSVDSACSAGLTALHLAVGAMRAGECDTAIVGAANAILAPGLAEAFDAPGLMACELRPFDAAGRGYVRGEGAVVLVLRRRAAVQADGGRAYAVVAGTATNTAARAGGLYAPTADRQEALVAAALRSAGATGDQVAYVEAHGTGTKAGDQVEGRALARALRPQGGPPVRLGSLKANIGHLEGASGLAGALKTCLVLAHGTIPPTIHHHRMRPALARQPIEVPTTAQDWPAGAHLAGVSAFGFGGANAHALLCAYTPPAAPPPPAGAGGAVLIPLGGASRGQLRATAAAWAPQAAGMGVGEVAAAASSHHDPAPAYRSAVIAATPDEAAAALAALAEGAEHPAAVPPARAPAATPGLVWVFPGHGAQWQAMGALCYQRLPVFRAAVEQARGLLAEALGRPVWAPGASPEGFEAAQHAIFCTQVGLAAQWRAWGYAPGAVVGHSLGEVAAAHAAGALGLEQAVRVLAARTGLLAEIAHQGELLSVPLGQAEAEAAVARAGLAGRVAVAVANAPNAVVLTGASADMCRLHHHLTAADVKTRFIADAPPAHSRLVEPLLPRMRTALADLAPGPARAEFISAADGAAYSGQSLDAGYWARQLRSPVYFADAVATAAQRTGAGCTVLEVAPRTVLAHHVHTALHHRGLGACVVAAPAAGGDDHAGLLGQLARLHAAGHTPASWPQQAPTRARLPIGWHHPARTEQAPDWQERLNGAQPGELAGLITAALAAHLAAALGRDLTTADHQAVLGEVGVDSGALLSLHLQATRLHPALAGLAAATDAVEMTLPQLGEALAQHIIAHRTTDTDDSQEARA